MKGSSAKSQRKNSALRGASAKASASFAILLDVAQRSVDNSSASDAKNFDVARWLKEWIELPQLALGGKRPAELLESPDGVEMVVKILRAAESGVYL